MRISLDWFYFCLHLSRHSALYPMSYIVRTLTLFLFVFFEWSDVIHNSINSNLSLRNDQRSELFTIYIEHSFPKSTCNTFQFLLIEAEICLNWFLWLEINPALFKCQDNLIKSNYTRIIFRDLSHSWVRNSR